MSYSPAVSLVRLQELKLWQGTYEDSLEKSKKTSNKQTSGTSQLIFNTSVEKENMKDWDKREISPSKQPFEQLVEEKLAEDQPIEVTNKPKRPFLKKGQGIARFKMSCVSVKTRKSIRNNTKKPDNKKRNVSNSPIIPVEERKGILKKPNNQFQKEIDLTPLTVPDFIKPRGTWRAALENASACPEKIIDNTNIRSQAVDDNKYEKFRRSLDFTDVDVEVISTQLHNQQHEIEKFKVDSVNALQPISGSNFGDLNKSIMDKIKEYAMKRFSKEKLLSNDIPEHLPHIMSSPRRTEPGDYTLEEQRSETELKNFEALEKRVENSSFCSTNTSIVNLLASTPRRNYDKVPDEGVMFVNDQQESIELKLKQISQKTDVLRNFLVNLHKMGTNDYDHNGSSSSGKCTSTATSFTEEDIRWSTRSPSLADNCTEYDSSYPSESWKKIDAGVNTSFESYKLDETVKNYEQCKDCEELRSRLAQKTNFTNLQVDYGKLKSQLKDVEGKYDILKRELKTNEIKYMEKMERLEEEVEIERKKCAKEKAYFENYVKDAQNRPTRKEREEITQLKQELADAKELLRLKDTKNGATQARLRTQIKQQEKELSELKCTVEKLQKENAKLSVNQKYMRRPTEVKMLQEINKNLSKLTEETFKNKLNKSGHGDGNDSSNSHQRKQNVTDSGNKENKNFKNTFKETDRKLSKPQSRDALKNETAEFDFANSDNTSLEKQYEHEFGTFTSPKNNCSSSLDKTEKVLSDGSIEISYSNGNLKTISSDGQIIKIQYFNGDIKETNLKDNIIKYHYSATDSLHVQYPDGSEVLEYPEGQKCKKYPDGKTEVSYPDGSLRIIYLDGSEEQQFPDGRKTLKKSNGDQIIFLSNGQKEVHTSEYKRREYPDGTVRTLYKDGTVETVYSNGRVRLKDSSGTLIMDTHQEL